MRSSYPAFETPFDCLFQVEGIVPDDEFDHPQMFDLDNKPCVLLIKNGHATDTTIGRCNGIKSFVRRRFPDGTVGTSMELAIMGHSKFTRSFKQEFSNCGDSGAIIVDGRGRAAALLTGVCGNDDYTDITYGTPFEWLWDRIKAKFPNAYFYPPIPTPLY